MHYIVCECDQKKRVVLPGLLCRSLTLPTIFLHTGSTQKSLPPYRRWPASERVHSSAPRQPAKSPKTLLLLFAGGFLHRGTFMINIEGENNAKKRLFRLNVTSKSSCSWKESRRKYRHNADVIWISILDVFDELKKIFYKTYYIYKLWNHWFSFTYLFLIWFISHTTELNKYIFTAYVSYFLYYILIL